MKCLEGKDDTFGSRLGSSVIYNPMTRLQLERVLKDHNLLGSRFERPYFFFPELLDKLYFEMERASDRPLRVLSCVFMHACLFQLPQIPCPVSASVCPCWIDGALPPPLPPGRPTPRGE